MDNFLFPIDFIILDMEEDAKIPLILGRPFLEPGRALIDMELGELILIFQDVKITFNVFKVMCQHNKNPQCYSVEVVEEVDARQSPLLYIKVNSSETLEKIKDKEVKEYMHVI